MRLDKPGGEGATKQQMIDCYVQTLAKILGTLQSFNFSSGVAGVLFVLPDSYVDPENKDYGAEFFVNGEIVQRSPEGREGWSHSHREQMTDPDTMTEPDMFAAEKIQGERARVKMSELYSFWHWELIPILVFGGIIN